MLWLSSDRMTIFLTNFAHRGINAFEENLSPTQCPKKMSYFIRLYPSKVGHFFGHRVYPAITLFWVLELEESARVVISAGRNYFSRPGGRNWQKLAETGLNRQKLAEIKNLNLMD